MPVKNKVQLITYPDSMGGDLKALHALLQKHFKDVFQGGIHILPPFPSSGDRGFAPLTYLEIEPAFGTWEDIRNIGEDHDVLVDLMVNHISKESPYFQNFLKEGKASPYASIFLTLDKIWPDGIPVQSDIDKMFLRRELPYSTFTIEKTGSEEKVWTTFGRQNPSEQIDLDVQSVKTLQLLSDFMHNFKNQQVKIVRLDAVGYIIKKLGTSCFFVEPELFDFMEWMNQLAKKLDLELLPEVHAHYSIQYRLAENGYWIYDFILPYMVLELLVNKDSSKFKSYLKNRPEKQFTMLDCHDGIPVKPDLDDLVTSKEAQKIVDVCLDRGANLSKIVSEKHKSPDGFDVHQIRCSYYSALDENDDAYLAARAIQFFVPGIPQVYYVGLLAGANDVENVLKTGEGREINRHNYSNDEVDSAVQKPVVQRLLKLIKFRNEYPAFNGTFSVIPSDNHVLGLIWQLDSSNKCTLWVDLNSMKSHIEYTDSKGQTLTYLV